MTLNHGAITANIEWHCAILSPMGVQTNEDCYSLFCVRDNEELGKTYDHDSILTIHHTAYMEHHKPANPPTQNSLLGGKGELWGGCGCLLPKGNQECLKNAPRRSWRLWWLWEIFSQNLFLKRFFDGFVHHRNI